MAGEEKCSPCEEKEDSFAILIIAFLIILSGIGIYHLGLWLK